MFNKLSKLLLTTLCVASITSLSGCVKLRSSVTSDDEKKDPDYILNNGRDNSGYDYDWINFIDIAVYGTDGNAYLEVKERELKSTDFLNDEDYLNITSKLNEMDLNYVGGQSQSSKCKISVNKGYNLSSGDVIMLTFTGSFGNESIYGGAYEYRVGQLRETTTVDLFSTDNIMFYGLEGTTEVFYKYPVNSVLNDIDGFTDNVKYSISTSTTELEADKTILNIKASINDDFLQENDYNSFTLYLAKLGYATETFEGKSVLHEIATTINFEDEMTAKETLSTVEQAITDEEELVGGDGNGYNLSAVCNIQKMSRDKDQHTYYAVYRDTNSNGDVLYYRRQIRMCELNGEIIVLKVEKQESTQEMYATQAYSDSTLLYVNESIATQTVEEQAEEVVEEVTEETVSE